MTLFLRETSAEYGKNTTGIWSPLDRGSGHYFTDSEKALVPDTYLRLIMYTKEKYFVSRERGHMLPEGFATTATAQTSDSSGASSSDYRSVAGCTCIMANMYHEALCFLKGLLDGHICLNKQQDPISLTSMTEAIATMFYLNDALINVDAGIFGILSSKKILDAYGLSFDFDVMSTWVSGTPEAISGEGRLLSQVGVIPAKTDCANLGGNHASPGRRNVASSRGRIVNSFHMA